MTHPSRSLSGRMSVGVQSGPTKLTATQTAALAAGSDRSGLYLGLYGLIDHNGKCFLDNRSAAAICVFNRSAAIYDLRVNEYTAKTNADLRRSLPRRALRLSAPRRAQSPTNERHRSARENLLPRQRRFSGFRSAFELSQWEACRFGCFRDPFSSSQQEPRPIGARP